MDAPEDRLPLPAVTNWPSFPFEGEMRVRAVEPYSATEEPRDGEPGGKECIGCGPDDGYIWTNERWRLKTLAPFSPLPLSLILETREHIDMADFSDELASELGLLTVKITRTGEAMEGVGRVHTYRWGDGAEHFHIWYLARPFGANQLRGINLPYWALTLPPIDEAVTTPNNEAIVAALG